ncbi:MAG: type VI secretion system baseplate subunit TssK [Desulfatirhabdiaceae bacterium]
MSEGPIYWHQGLFLQPQHFQLLNRQAVMALAPMLAAIRPHFWGITACAVNEAALAAGRLEINAVSLLFPGYGQLIRYPENAVCSGRQISINDIPVDGALMAYIGIRALKPGEPNVTVADTAAEMAAASTRFAVLSGTESVPDLYSNGPIAQIRRLSHVLNLIIEPEIPQAGDLDLIPVARLMRDGDKIVADVSFVPPCLTLNASSLLSGILKEVRDHVLGKARELEGYKNLTGRGAETGELTILLMGLRTLSRFAARIDHAVDDDSLSPWDAYGMLRELVAELSVFSLDVSAMGETSQDDRLVPAYNHSDLGKCFRRIRDAAVSLLDGISAGPRFVTRFEFHDPYWTAELPHHVLAEAASTGSEFWLLLYSELSEPHTMRDSAARLLKLSATSGMASLLVRALPGIPLSISEGPPAGLPRRRGALYFRIGRESPLWSDVLKGGSISMYWNEAPSDMEAQLAVLSR